MGTFVGHILPGTFFFIYGIFYIIRDAFSLAKNRIERSSGEISATQDRRINDTRHSEHSKARSKEQGTKPRIVSFDFESEEEDTTVFSRTLAKGDFPPNPGRSSLADEAGLYSSDSDGIREYEDETYIYNHREDVIVRPGCSCRCKEWFADVALIEGILKIVCSVIGTLGELWWVDWYMISPRTGNFTNMNNWQHATMFAFFGVSGITDIVFQTCLKTTPPSNHGKIFLSLAFWVEYLLFSFHTRDVAEVEADFHRLLLVAIGLCAVASGLGVWCYRPAAPGVRRIWVTAMCLQGTWFWQIAFTLYNPWRHRDDSPWEKPGSHMMLTSLFAWHVLAIISITFTIHVVIRYCLKFRCKIKTSHFTRN